MTTRSAESYQAGILRRANSTRAQNDNHHFGKSWAHSQEWLCHCHAELSRVSSLLEVLLQARDFVLKARDAASHRKVVNEKDGPHGEISRHQAIEIFHFVASDPKGNCRSLIRLSSRAKPRLAVDFCAKIGPVMTP